MSLDLSKYSKSPITDISLVSKTGETLWYSKYQLTKISPVFSAIFFGDSSVTEIKIDYDTNIITHMLDYIEDKKLSESFKTNIPFLLEIYKLTHQYNYEQLENYITDTILENSITNEVLVEFKKRNNKKYIKAVETMMIKGEIIHNNCDSSSDMIEIYRQVLDVVQRTIYSIKTGKADLREIDTVLSTIPGIKRPWDVMEHNYSYINYSCRSEENLSAYDTRRNSYNHKKKIVHIMSMYGEKEKVFNVDKHNTFFINQNATVTHKYDHKNANKKILITEVDKKILSEYHDIKF